MFIKRQAITRTSDESVHRRIYTFPGLNVFTIHSIHGPVAFCNWKYSYVFVNYERYIDSSRIYYYCCFLNEFKSDNILFRYEPPSLWCGFFRSPIALIARALRLWTGWRHLKWSTRSHDMRTYYACHKQVFQSGISNVIASHSIVKLLYTPILRQLNDAFQTLSAFLQTGSQHISPLLSVANLASSYTHSLTLQYSAWVTKKHRCYNPCYLTRGLWCGLYLTTIFERRSSLRQHSQSETRCENSFQLTWIPKYEFLSNPGASLLKFRSLMSPLREILIPQKCRLYTSTHVHIYRVSRQLSCGDTCKICTWYHTGNHLFDNSENFGK